MTRDLQPSPEIPHPHPLSHPLPPDRERGATTHPSVTASAVPSARGFSPSPGGKGALGSLMRSFAGRLSAVSQSPRTRSDLAQRLCCGCERIVNPPNGSAAAANAFQLAQRLCRRCERVFLLPDGFAAAAKALGVRNRPRSDCEDVGRQNSASQRLRRRWASEIRLAAAAKALGARNRPCSDNKGVWRMTRPLRSGCEGVGRPPNLVRIRNTRAPSAEIARLEPIGEERETNIEQ